MYNFMLSTAIYNQDIQDTRNLALLRIIMFFFRRLSYAKILPPSCFDVDGMVLKPQLRTALHVLGYQMYEEEFDKVWDRQVYMFAFTVQNYYYRGNYVNAENCVNAEIFKLFLLFRSLLLDLIKLVLELWNLCVFSEHLV